MRWLTTEPVKNNGAVLSWVNPDHPGYPYPEAAGLWLTLTSQRAPHRLRQRNLVATNLVRRISNAGGLGRDEREYIFDTAIALQGLLAHKRAGGSLIDTSAPDPTEMFTN